MSEFKYPYLNPYLPLDVRVNDLVSRMTLDEKIGIIPTRQKAVERLGIKEYHVGGEAAHGVVARIGDATVFPQPIGLSCTWNTKLLKEIGSAIGDEARAYYKIRNELGGLTLWAPTIDMERDPRWGRTEEAYGEDPYLTGKLSANLIKGMQGEHPFYLKLVPAPKHFYANNNEVGRIWGSSSIDPRNKYEYYLQAFKPAFVEGKACSMMTAYNEINGTPAIVNKEVQTIVKDEWGCNGFIVCDGGDMSQTVEYHKYYTTHAETVANAIKSGVDVMTDNQELVIASTKEAIEGGLLTENELDQAVKNVFKIRFRLGQFDPKELNPYASIDETVLCSKKHNDLALQAAKEAIVLLKNENNILPLSKEKLNKVAIIGPLADVVYRDWYTGTHPYKVTPLEGIKNKCNHKNVTFNDGNDIVTLLKDDCYLSMYNGENNPLMFNKTQVGQGELFNLTDWGFGNVTLSNQLNKKYVTTDDQAIYGNASDIWGWFVREAFKLNRKEDGSCTLKTWNNRNITLDEHKRLIVTDNLTEDHFQINVVKDGIQEAARAAKHADVSIVFVGNHPLINGKEEIDRTDITLPEHQEKLIQAVYEANPNTIVVIVGSYPFAINWVNEHIPAILYTAHGCQELGNAISDVLFGDYSPAGRLSMTWYKSIDQLPDLTDYDIIKGKRTYMYFDEQPLYPFGYGMSYCTFEYNDLQLSTHSIQQSDEVSVTFKVTNVGRVCSDEVVQLYVKSIQSKVKRPNKQLKAFKRIHLEANESKVIRFILKAQDFEIWDVTRSKYCVESGTYQIMIGKSSKDIVLSEHLFISGEVIPNRDLTKLTKVENYDDYHLVKLGESKEGFTRLIEVKKGSWIGFKDVQLKEQTTTFNARCSSMEGDGCIEIRLNHPTGELIGLCKVNLTGDWQKWETFSCQIKPLNGVYDVYLVFTDSISMSWFKFS